MRRFASLVMSGLLLTASVLVSGAAAAPTKVIPATNGKALNDQYIVVVKEGADARSIAAVAGVSPKYVYDAALNGFAATLNAGQLNALQHNSNVDYIEQDAEVTTHATQYSAPWNLDRIDQRNLPLTGTYTYNTTAPGVTAYIIDSGIYTGHPEFGGRARNVYDAFGGTGADCNGHGTHIAGIIGATTYGVAKMVQLRGVRVVDCLGSGTISSVIAGVDYVRTSAVKPAVANISLGGSANTSLDTAVNNLANSGVFVSVAAGDGNACNYSPGRATYAYTVSASDRNDNVPVSAGYGSCVKMYAPGVSIISTWHTGGTNTLSGTSMAAPHVAGCAAKYKATYGDAASTTVANWLNTTATTGVLKGVPTGTPNRLLYCPL